MHIYHEAKGSSYLADLIKNLLLELAIHLPIGAVRNLVSEIDILERVLLPLTLESPILKSFFSF